MHFTFIVAVFLALAPLRPASAGGSDAAEAMAEAMARMMEAMGMLDVDDRARMPSMPYMMPGMGGLGYGQMPWTQMPWSQIPGYGAFSDPIKAFGMPGFANQMGSASAWPWGGAAAGTLDGVWEGRDGGLLIVRGQRFRLQAAQGGHIEGVIRRRGDRLVLYEPTSETTKAYEMAMQQGRMVLRDDAGYTYLYRRLWLDEPAYGAGHAD